MVVYLNGPINSGKTTVSQLLAVLIPYAVRIEIDDLPRPANISLEESIKPLLVDAADLACNWHRRGFHVIVVWPISAQDHAQFLERLCNAGAAVFTFTLAPRQEVALTNRGNRELTDWERKRIQYHYATGIHCPPFGTILDNTDEPPKQTAKRVIEKLTELGAVF